LSQDSRFEETLADVAGRCGFSPRGAQIF